EEQRREVEAVDRPVGGNLGAGELEDRRQQINRAGDVARDGSRGDLSGPPEDAGLAHAALPRTALPFAEQPRRAAVLVLDEPGAIVAREDDERLLLEPFGTERLQHPADAPVELLDDVAVDPPGTLARERLGRVKRHV